MSDSNQDQHRLSSDPPQQPIGSDINRDDLSLARFIATGAKKSAGNSFRRNHRKPSADPQFSGSHPDERDPAVLASGLANLVQRQGWTKQLTVRQLLKYWPSLVGLTVSEHSKPEIFKESVLTIRTDSTAWAGQLRLLSPVILATIAGRIGDGIVQSITVLGPDAPSWKHGHKVVKGRGPRDTYG